MPGKVYLIGAGPGDPGLITVKGLSCLQKANVVVYDRLVDHRLLNEAGEGAQLIYVGKTPGEHTIDQKDINHHLVTAALEGNVVARLKGGDPFVFGRGGEEAEALAQANIPFEVVPGVSSAVAAPAYAGIPITHRGVSSTFTVVSGSEDPSKSDSSVQWNTVARSGGTIVVLMGWDALQGIVATLLNEGMAPSTPVALVRCGTQPYQKTVTGSLANIVRKGIDARLSAPIVAVIGGVVDLREKLRWFDDRPLFGKRVLVTRSRNQASVLSRLLADEGAEPVELPTIQISPIENSPQLDNAIASLGAYDWTIFTSANAVESFFTRAEALRRDSRAFGGVKVGAIGPATGKALERRGIIADLIPDEYVAETLVRAMGAHDLTGTRVLLPSSDIGRHVLANGLTQLGASVEQLLVYRTSIPSESRDLVVDLLKDQVIDLITFTSSSTVNNLLDLLNGDSSLIGESVVACIGPITAKTAKERGLQIDIVAEDYTVPGLIWAMKKHFASEEVG